MTHRPTHEASSATHAAGPGDDLARWRQQRLLRAGFAPGLAASIASDCAVDLHALIELVERGCPPELAARIVAPLDDHRNPC